MIKHIVMWKLKDFAEGADKAANAIIVKNALETCRGLVPGMLTYEVTLASDEGRGRGWEMTCDAMLYSEFSDLETLQTYAKHPKHVAIKAVIGPRCEARQCMDYEA